MGAMETRRYQNVNLDDEHNQVGTIVPVLTRVKDKDINTFSEIKNTEAAQEIIKFPKVNHNKLNSMLGMEETLNMTLSVNKLPNQDADLEEESDSKVDPYYILKGIDNVGKRYLFTDGSKEYVKQRNSAKWTISLDFLDVSANIVDTESEENSDQQSTPAEKKHLMELRADHKSS